MSEEYKKDFDAWNDRAKELDSRVFDDFFYEREVWWCALGTNIGSEQDGKNESLERPILILKKIRKDIVLVAPLTSMISAHTDRISAKILGKESQILLSQTRSISNKRLLRKIGSISISLYQACLMRYAELILRKSETPLGSGESRSPKAIVA